MTLGRLDIHPAPAAIVEHGAAFGTARRLGQLLAGFVRVMNPLCEQRIAAFHFRLRVWLFHCCFGQVSRLLIIRAPGYRQHK
jgi:hypothetical protein